MIIEIDININSKDLYLSKMKKHLDDLFREIKSLYLTLLRTSLKLSIALLNYYIQPLTYGYYLIRLILHLKNRYYWKYKLHPDDYLPKYKSFNLRTFDIQLKSHHSFLDHYKFSLFLLVIYFLVIKHYLSWNNNVPAL